MSPAEHAVEIRKCTKQILRWLATRNYAEIVPLLDTIDEHTFDIQTGK